MLGTDMIGTGNNIDNLIEAGDGNDTLNGLAGADTLEGGEGNDIYYVDNINDVINEESGTDLCYSSVSYSLAEDVENLVLTGKAVCGTGNDLSNSITGNNYNNILDGAGGNDTLAGGKGNDVYYVHSPNDIIIEYNKQGTDTVNSDIQYSLGIYMENLTLTGSDTIDGMGNSYDNIITGNSSNNHLYGYAGNDILQGCGGNDTLEGGIGNDTYMFTTGDGQDSLVDISGKDTVKFSRDVIRDNIAFYFDKVSGNLTIDYGSAAGQDEIVFANNTIEKIQLGNGKYLSVKDINKIIQDITKYETDHNLIISNVADVKSHTSDLMVTISKHWHG